MTFEKYAKNDKKKIEYFLKHTKKDQSFVHFRSEKNNLLCIKNITIGADGIGSFYAGSSLRMLNGHEVFIPKEED